MSAINVYAIRAIYRFEMARTRRTLMQSIVSPVISTALYFVVFGAAIGGRIPRGGGGWYRALIRPRLLLLSPLTPNISNASLCLYFSQFVRTLFQLLSGPGSP